MRAVSLIGTGYVADLHMKSLKTFPDIQIKTAYDRSSQRLAAFCRYWRFKGAETLDEVLKTSDEADLGLNPTNPSEHFSVSMAYLQTGRHVYSEKPLSTNMDDAYKRADLSDSECSGL
jgi:predicted dehydrogenase